MSDLEIFVTILSRAEIPYETITRDEGPHLIHTLVTITAGRKSNYIVIGYNDFYTDFIFDSNGTLETVGVWE